MRELERRHPTPSFYPAGRGAADALAWWAEKTTFSPAAGILFAKKPDALPEGFLEDRAKFSGRNIDPAAMMAAVPNLLDQLRAHFDWLDQMLADGRSFLQGSAAGLSRSRRLPSGLVLAAEFRISGGAARWLSEAADLGRARCRNRPRQAEPNDLASRRSMWPGTATSIASAIRDPRGPHRPEAWPDRHRHSGRYRTRSGRRRIGRLGRP
jgi:hypothetical protein